MRFLGQIITWASTLVVIRMLSPADYGLMELAMVFVSFLSMIGEMGLGAAIVQRHDMAEEDLQSVYGLILLVSLLLCFSLSCAAPFISAFYKEPQLTLIILFLSLVFLFSGLATVPYNLLLRDLEYRKIAILDFLAALAGSVTTLALAMLGMKVWALVFGVLSIRVTTLVVVIMFRPFFKMPRFTFKGLWPIVSFSCNATLSRIFWYVYSFAAASLIIGKVLGKESLGVYSVALLLACLPMDKIGGILNQVAFPAFSSIQANHQLVGRYFLKATRVIFVISVPVFFGISSVGPEIITIFFGNKWINSVVPLQIIALSVPLRMVRNLLFPALLGIGQSKINLVNESIAVVLMPLAFYVASSWGLVGLSSVWLLAFPIVFVLNLPMVANALHIKPMDIFRDMASPAFAGLLMVTIIYLVRGILPPGMNDVIRLSLFICIGAFVYLGISALVNRRGLEEVLLLMKRKKPHLP